MYGITYAIVNQNKLPSLTHIEVSISILDISSNQSRMSDVVRDDTRMCWAGITARIFSYLSCKLITRGLFFVKIFICLWSFLSLAVSSAVGGFRNRCIRKLWVGFCGVVCLDFISFFCLLFSTSFQVSFYHTLSSFLHLYHLHIWLFLDSWLSLIFIFFSRLYNQRQYQHYPFVPFRWPFL